MEKDKENSKVHNEDPSIEEEKDTREEESRKGKEDVSFYTPAIKQTNEVNFLEYVKEAEVIADYIIKSDTFGAVFEKNDKTGKPIKNKSDIITAIITGKELGLTPMASVTFGKQLDRHAFFKVMKGRALGIDPITSLDVINVISTKNGDITHTGVHVIVSALLKHNINFEFIEDGVEVYGYYRIQDDARLGDTLEDDYFVVGNKIDKDKVKTAKDSGKKLVYKKLDDVRTTIKMKRPNKPEFIMSYTRNEAIDADLYKGTKSDGSISTGKDNWNKHFKTMLRNRTITIAGRIYGGDVLQKTYSTEEAQEIAYEEVD